MNGSQHRQQMKRCMTSMAGKQSCMRFRCNVGLASVAVMYMATAAAAFLGNTYKATFVRRDHSAMQSTTLITPFLFKYYGPLSRLSMSNDEESDSSDDQDEWNALIAAFQMYRAAYGDLRVPLRFIVPSMPPWPSKLTATRCTCTARPYMCPSHCS